MVKCTAANFFPTMFSLFLGRIVRLDIPRSSSRISRNQHSIFKLVLAAAITSPTCSTLLFLLTLAHEESLHTPDWQLDSTDSTDDDKTRGPPQLDPVLIYTPTGSMETPSSTPAGSTDSEVFEGRDRLLSRSPRKGPNVFTVSFETFKT